VDLSHRAGSQGRGLKTALTVHRDHGNEHQRHSDFGLPPASREHGAVFRLEPSRGASALAAGRYALIIKGQVFDFTVDGQVTQTAQCLERTEAANGTFYSECRELR
jgi:hypothetical protein